MQNPIKNPFLKEIVLKMMSYCAYQERAPQELRLRMQKFEISTEETESVLAYLERENFLNEERFAESYAGSKFRVKGWGRLKIMKGLLAKGISSDLAKRAVESEIPQEDYEKRLREHLLKKEKLISGNDLLNEEKARKLMAYAQSKGFEWSAVQSAMKTLGLWL